MSAAAGAEANTLPPGAITSTNAGSNAAAVSGTLTVLGHPALAKSFSPNPVGIGVASVLTITLTNPNASAVTGAAFTDTYPAGLVNTASASGATTCGAGTVTAANNGNSVALSGGTIPAPGACTVTVNVTSATPGTYNNTNPAGPITTTNAGPPTAAAHRPLPPHNALPVAT